MNKIELTWNEIRDRAAGIAKHIASIMPFEEAPIVIYGVPKGGYIPAVLVEKYLCLFHKRNAHVTDDITLANVYIDDILDSGNTRNRYYELYPEVPFFALVDKQMEYVNNEWIIFPWEKDDKNQISTVENNIIRLMEYIGENPNREGLLETPNRVVRSFEKLYGGYKQNVEGVFKTFSDDTSNSMVILKDIEFYSTCEHHMLPFYGKAHIAYIPDGKVIGISKLARLLEIYTRRLQIQERIGKQVVEVLEKYLQPKGAICVLEAQHFCMTSRGVEKQNSKMITSELSGTFELPEVRNEFLTLLKG